MYGAWHFVHGHGGNVEESHNIASLERKGWGLSFVQRGGSTNWLHYAVPSNSQYNWRVDHVHLKFTAYEHAKVTEIHLWDGNIQFWQKSVDYSGGEVDVMIELGQEFELFRGLGVSIKTEADPGGDAQFVFHAVGANFRQLP